MFRVKRIAGSRARPQIRAVRAHGSGGSGDTLKVMSDDGRAWREETGGTRMSGSGSRGGFGSPPWDPAEPVPEPEGAQPLPGLGTIPGQDGGSQHNGSFSPGSGSAREQTTGADGGSGPGGTGGPGAGVQRETGQQPGPAQPSEGTAGRAGTEGDGTQSDDAQSDGAKSSGGQRQNARPGRKRRR